MEIGRCALVSGRFGRLVIGGRCCLLVLLDALGDLHDLLAGEVLAGYTGVDDELVEQEQADVVVTALPAHLERLVDDIEQAQQ